MSGQDSDAHDETQDEAADPRRSLNRHEEARIRQRHFSFVWLIPILASLIALWLGYRSLTQRGPLITISFNSGDGLTSDQTPVKYKAVQLGTVDSVQLSPDMTHVKVKVRMRAEGCRPADRQCAILGGAATHQFRQYLRVGNVGVRRLYRHGSG